jgi:hypothetical protein
VLVDAVVVASRYKTFPWGEMMCGLEFAYPATPSAEGARGPLPTIMPPPPTCVGVVAPPVPEEVEHTVTDGVMTLVTVPAPEYAREMEEAEPVQVLLVTSLVTSEESCWRVGDETEKEEPEASVTEKLVGFTTID